jgi:hypothetical protein
MDEQTRLAQALLPGAELRAYQPTLRDRLASFFVGDERASPEKARLVEGLLGSRGLGNTGMGLVDLTPAGAPLWTEEYKRAETPTDAAWAALNFIPGAKNMAQLGKGVVDDAVKGIRAYHASPHDFDRFDFSKIGTGEGHQVYGKGGYFAESAEVSGRGGHYDKQFSTPEKPAKIYEVAINADPEKFLDWDKPLRDQGHVVAALSDPASMGLKPQKITTSNGTVYSGWVDESGKLVGRAVKGDTPPSSLIPEWEMGHENVRGFNLINNYLKDDLAPKHLGQAGIPGIRYLDGVSRGEGAGSNNYVVFDDKLVEILRKYGLVGTAGPALMAQALLSSGAPPPDETY